MDLMEQNEPPREPPDRTLSYGDLGRVPDIEGGYPESELTDLEKNTRPVLALVLAGILIVTIIWLFAVATFATADVWDRVKGLGERLLPIEATLVSAAIGFYFGARKH